MIRRKYNEYTQHIRDLQCFVINDAALRNFITSSCQEKKRSMEEKDNTIDDNPSLNIKKTKETTYFVSCEKDQLFWIFYIITEGMTMYNYHKNSRFDIQNKIKYQLVDELHKKESALKENIKQNHLITLSAFEDQLVFQPTIHLNCFLQLCSYHNKSILLLFYHYRMYFKHNMMNVNMNKDTPSSFHVVHIRDFPKYYYGIEEVDDVYVSLYLTNRFSHFIETFSITTPFQPCSHYKLSQLQQLCSLHNIAITHSVSNQPLKKKDLYDALNTFYKK